MQKLDRAFYAQMQAKSVKAELIKNSPPIFFCGDDSNHIDCIPAGSIVKPLSLVLLHIGWDGEGGYLCSGV
jgi:hypothetical protein